MTQFDLPLKLAATAFLALGVTGISAYTIADMGTLIHFNCRSRNGSSICELTREPLIGKLQTQYLNKTDLAKTSVQSKSGIAGASSRLVLVTQSGEEIPLTENWSRSANEQLFAQRDQVDRFLSDQQAESLSVRTHRPGQLWAILGIVSIIGGTIAYRLWLPKLTQ